MTKSKRVKSDQKLIPINDWTGADDILRQTGDLQAKIGQLQGKAKLQIDKIKADMAVKVDKLNAQIKVCVRSIEAFATTRRSDLGKKKSKLLNFGTIGWRLSTSISIKKDTTLELIKQIFSKAMAKRFIRLKETVDKEAMARLTDGQLAEVGAKRKVTDDFFAEPSAVEAADHETGKCNDL